MKGSETFTQDIKNYLDDFAAKDSLFAIKYANEKKNIEDCITYILNTVQQSNCNGFADGEIYSMAIHYYEEEEIEVGKRSSVRVVVNHHVELTEDEKAAMKQKALDDAYEQQRKSLIAVTKKNNATKVEQPTLFLFD